ncbi:hypothetical protein PR202_gb22773 [Eleusine coracana subsp. coracana]|uniref:F-box domain-containing protein n=1 Tax=Eleusine coracana subsp. coracana TaxID=191504 RepID=A0AAV5FH68_ELECO|nr:hypothetical protein PR202_gb22773 [Eleusine coracana subsp. coracana]
MEQKKARAADESVRLICDDALTEVFRRLPARTLAACRLVCKSWMSVLSDPHFIHEHLCLVQKKLLFFANDRVHDRSLAMVFADDKESMYHVSRPMASRSIFVHNSCNGILCLGDSTGAVELLNPTTSESLVLPTPMYTAGSSQFSSRSEELKMACTELDIPFSTHTFTESIVPLRKDYFMKLRIQDMDFWHELEDSTPVTRVLSVNKTGKDVDFQQELEVN